MRISKRNAALIRYGIKWARLDPGNPIPGNGLDRKAFNRTVLRNYIRATERRNAAVREMVNATRELVVSFDREMGRIWNR